MVVLSTSTPVNVAAPGSLRSARLSGFLFFFLFAGQAVRNLIGWPGYITVAVILFALVFVELWQRRSLSLLRRLPVTLLAFLTFSAASLIWSYYQWTTVLGLMGQWSAAAGGLFIALTLSWEQLLDALSSALRWILGLSLLFEFFVTFALRDRLAPLWLSGVGGANGSTDNLPGAFYWSENRLLELGPIQGIVGNRNLLAFIALLVVITCTLQLLRQFRLSHRMLAWLALAGITLALTRSATVILAAVALAVVAGLVIAVRRSAARFRPYLYSAGWTVIGVGVTLSAMYAHTIFGLLGRGDMSNRTGIWKAVAALAEQRPLIGWGWVSYWAPWVYPYNNLIVIDGVEYLQAHNALLDVWLQLGLLGAILAAALALVASVRAWQFAVNAKVDPLLAALPLLLIAALLFQSLTESRLLIEGNWLLFVALTAKLALEHQRGSTRRTLWSEVSRVAGTAPTAAPQRRYGLPIPR